MFYLATPPELFPVITAQLGAARLNRPSNDRTSVRLVVEKPFGTDLGSAQRLNRDVQKVFRESQVYRIDHYLAKERLCASSGAGRNPETRSGKPVN